MPEARRVPAERVNKPFRCELIASRVSTCNIKEMVIGCRLNQLSTSPRAIDRAQRSKDTDFIDTVVAPTTPEFWNLVDLPGCEVGVVEEAAPDEYRMTLGERVADTMRTMKHGPFTTLDTALSEIKIFTRSTCRMAPTDGPKPEA